MFKKELADVAKQTAIFIPVVVLLPAVFLALHLVGRRMSYIAVLLPVYQIGLLFWALFLGSSLLMQERDQRAVEYILSMPYSRLQMIGYKILPRVMILSVLSFLFWLLYRMNGSMYAAIGIEPFIITLAFFFIISICLAPIVENFLVLTLVTMFSAAACWTIVLTIIWLIHHSPNQGATLMAHFKGVFTLSWLYTEKWLGPLLWIDALILLVPFLLAFITTVRKFDTRPGARHNRRFASFFIPAALIAVAATHIHSDAVIPLGPQYFQLTRDHKLIEFRDSMCTIYEENRTLKICPKDGLDDLTMKKSDKLAFFSNYRDESKKIDLESGVVTDLSPTDKKIRLQDVLQDGRSHYLFETRDNAPDKIRLVKLTEDFQETEEIIFRNDLFKNDYFSNELLGSNTFEGKRYWLAYLRNHLHYLDKGFYGNLLRLWENGRVENFPIASGIFADYLNNLIFIYAKEGLAILKDTGSGFETVKTISKNKRLSFRIGDYFSHRRVPSDSPLMKNVYFIIDDKIVRLDLETLEIQEIADVKSGTNVRVMNYPIDGSFVVEEDPALRKETFYRLEGDRLNPVRTFSLEKVKDIEFPEQKPFTEWKEQFDVSEGGVIYQKGKTVRVFAWPDLRELKFKGL